MYFMFLSLILRSSVSLCLLLQLFLFFFHYCFLPTTCYMPHILSPSLLVVLAGGSWLITAHIGIDILSLETKSKTEKNKINKKVNVNCENLLLEPRIYFALPPFRLGLFFGRFLLGRHRPGSRFPGIPASL
jgi:hypothetical protein